MQDLIYLFRVTLAVILLLLAGAAKANFDFLQHVTDDSSCIDIDTLKPINWMDGT